jgi:hypothetical protein
MGSRCSDLSAWKVLVDLGAVKLGPEDGSAMSSAVKERYKEAHNTTRTGSE